MSTVQKRMRGWFGVGLAIALSGIPAAVSAIPAPGSRVMAPVSQSPSETSVPVPVTDDLLVSIRREGGFCMAPGCFSEVAIFNDGTYRYSTHTSSPVTGRIGTGKLERLQARISQLEPTDLYAQPPIPQPIDNFCGLAFDGPEVVYTFQRDGELAQVRGCEMAIAPDHPMVQRLERLYSRLAERATSDSESFLNSRIGWILPSAVG
jgi:hypothetical protein